jgi:hypothetical protein
MSSGKALDVGSMTDLKFADTFQAEFSYKKAVCTSEIKD